MYNPKVAIIDSGVDKDNKSIMRHVVQGFAFEKNIEENKILESFNYDDVFGHGTNCADYILQMADMAQLYPIKIVNKLGKTTCELLVAALRKCMNLPIDIICVSLSVTQVINADIEKELQDTCRDIAEQGKIICASECNNMGNSIPAIYDSVIGVKALDNNVKKKIVVNKDTSVQVMTDISPVFVAGKSGKYNFFKGTSKANAYIVGVLTALMQRGKRLGNMDQALNQLKDVDSTPETIEKESLGKIQSDELGKMILQEIQEVLLKFGCTYSMDEVRKYPFISKITGVNFFNFYEFISVLYEKLGITECDYHLIKIGDVCTLYNLIEHLKGKMCHEKKECSIGTNKKI